MDGEGSADALYFIHARKYDEKRDVGIKVERIKPVHRENMSTNACERDVQVVAS
jgi:hypothetical protein